MLLCKHLFNCDIVIPQSLARKYMLKRLGPLFDKAIFSGVKNDIGTFISSSAGSRSQELGFALFASFALASSANFCSLVSIGNSNFRH